MMTETDLIMCFAWIITSLHSLTLDDTDDRPIGKYGRMHREYLKEHRPAFYNGLILSCQLHTYLADLNEQATERCERINCGCHVDIAAIFV